MSVNSIGHYRIEAQLGAGGMGAVYRAYDTRLERTVALKFPASVDETAQARLLNEARLASALNHPHICTIYEVGEADGQVYIAMEHVAGEPLSTLIPGDGLPVESLLRYATQMAGALAHAHQRSIIHCDLKSSNVIITPEGCAKVLDFGLARRLRPEELGEATCSRVSLATGDTIAGTLHYLAPEVLRGQPADARADLWALGVLLHEMAAGELPFQGRTAFELSAAILREQPQPLPAGVPAGLRAVIQRCLAKEPAQRYQHAAEVQAALEVIQSSVGAAFRPPVQQINAARILLVEDEPGIAFGLQEDLKIEGYDVEIESDGESALQRARKEIFDLILLDVMLPRKDGYEVCRELRRGGSKTPIILLTAKAQEAEKVMGLEIGADDYVTKPFSPCELRARVKAVLRGRGYRFDA